jgi:predicted MFS family arabinose efflux permease
LYNALSYVAVLVGLAMMDVDGKPPPRRGKRRSQQGRTPPGQAPVVAGQGDAMSLPAQNPLDGPEHHDGHHDGPASLGEGVRYLFRHKNLALLMVLSTAMALFGWPTLTLLPALADVRFGEREKYGLLVSATGGGALLAALLVATFNSRGWQKAFLAAGVVLAVVSLTGLSRTDSFIRAAGCCTLLGVGLILFFPTGQAIIQLGATDHNRGMIMGIWSMLLAGAVPLGSMMTGEAADQWGVPAVLDGEALGIVLASIGVFVAAVLWRKRELAPDPLARG